MFSRLSPPTILCATAIVAVGELATGTRLEFVLGVMLIMVCAGVTFNILDGFTSLAGILYAEFALRTIVLSQFVKVALFERADSNLEAPYLTISLYAIFYACVLLSVFIFSRFRLPVPKPLNPVSDSHARKLYIIALVVGSAATAVAAAKMLNPIQISSAARTIAMQLSELLLFAVVVAVDRRITNTSGRSSIGWDAVLPILLLQGVSFLATAREAFLAPALVYYAYAWARGYRFGKMHLVFAVAFGLIFFFVVSPIYVFNKSTLVGLYFQDRVNVSVDLMRHPRAVSGMLSAQEITDNEMASRFRYYNATDNNVISRFALLRPDGDLISACSRGYRYGWATIKNDLLYALPKALYPNKPQYDASAITGHVAGLNDEWEANAETAFSPIADSYAGFGTLGIVLFGLFGLPLFLIVCRSAFDISKPWGMVALGLCIINFGEWTVGHTLVEIVELPLMLFGMSWLIGIFALLVPTRADNLGRNGRALGGSTENSAFSSVK